MKKSSWGILVPNRGVQYTSNGNIIKLISLFINKISNYKNKIVGNDIMTAMKCYMDTSFINYMKVIIVGLNSNSKKHELIGRIMDKCEENRVYLTFVSLSYTSQKCSSCGEIHKESRKGEIYKQ